jgi:hypothetical protein
MSFHTSVVSFPLVTGNFTMTAALTSEPTKTLNRLPLIVPESNSPRT